MYIYVCQVVPAHRLGDVYTIICVRLLRCSFDYTGHYQSLRA